MEKLTEVELDEYNLTPGEDALKRTWNNVRRYYPDLSIISDDDHIAGLLLSHLNFWCEQRGQLFCRTDDQLASELLISKDKLRAARGILRKKQFIIVRRAGMPARNYYIVHYNNIKKALQSLKKYNSEPKETIQSLKKSNSCLPSDGTPDFEKIKDCDSHKLGTENSLKYIKESKKESKESAPSKFIDSENDEDGFSRRLTKKQAKAAEKKEDPMNWGSREIRDHLAKKFEETYEHESGEYKHTERADGQIVSKIKAFIDKCKSEQWKMGGLGIKEYIDWAFEVKAGKSIHLSFGLIASDGMIGEGIAAMKNGKFKATIAEEQRIMEKWKSRKVYTKETV